MAYSVVYSGVWWCTVVCSGVYSGAQWCMVVYSGVQWCVQWRTVVYSGVWWCVQWCTVVYGGVQWCMVVCTVAYSGVQWCIFTRVATAEETVTVQGSQASNICSVCSGNEPIVSCPEHHSFCSNCFDHVIKTQVDEGRIFFVSIGCKLCCPCCPSTQQLPAFVMRTCAPLVSATTYQKYEDCIVQKAIIDTQKQYEARLEQARLENAQLEKQGDSEFVEVDKLAAFIGERLIFARCPNLKCANQLLDFEACAAIKCDPKEGGCGTYFCAWCLQSQPEGDATTAKVECHTHVRACPFNPSKNLFPPQPHPQIWQTVMHELARKRVKEYIQSVAVPEKLRKRVHEECRTRYPDIQLQHADQVVSDGFREIVEGGRATRVFSFEQNITTLMRMGLGNRARVQHALEAMQNDLTAAVNLLLGIGHIRPQAGGGV